jgi:hypothetical protein
MSVIKTIKRAGALALLWAVAPAGAATAATLNLTVPTHDVKHGQSFSISASGSFKRAELKGKAFLMLAFQYDSRTCQPTAQAEFGRHDTYFFFHKTIASSPFTRSSSWTAGSPGARRICAYLYPKSVTPADKLAPLVRTSGFFRVVK